MLLSCPKKNVDKTQEEHEGEIVTYPTNPLHQGRARRSHIYTRSRQLKLAICVGSHNMYITAKNLAIFLLLLAGEKREKKHNSEY